MTIDELMHNFRLALQGIAPRFEYVGMAWKRPDTYDNWDELAAAIYAALVVEPLCSASLPEELWHTFKMPQYAAYFGSYAGMSVIELLPADPSGLLRVPVELETEKEPFDTILWYLVDQHGKKHAPYSPARESPFADVHFAYRHYLGGKWADPVESVVIPSGFYGQPPL